MAKILFAKKFEKQFSKLSRNVQSKFLERLDIFIENKNDPILRNHKLHGKLEGKWSINISGDVRAIYEIVDEDIYFFLMIGSHSELYK